MKDAKGAKDAKDLLYLDGRIVPRVDVNLQWDAPGFRQGYGLFETVRVSRGRAFLGGLHAQRITEAAPKLGIEPWLHARTLARGLDTLVGRTGVIEGALRIFLMPGAAPPGEDPSEGTPGDALEDAFEDPARAIVRDPVREGVDGPAQARVPVDELAGFEAGVLVRTGVGNAGEARRPAALTPQEGAGSLLRARYLGAVSNGRAPRPPHARAVLAPDLRDPLSPLVGLKTISYAGERLLLARARQQGADEALRRNLSGRLAEGTRSNLFLIEGRRLVTPPLAEGLLAGVTRWFLLRIAPENGLDPLEEPVPVERLMAADEAFLSSTLRGVIPLVALDGLPIAGGRPGPLSLRLAATLERHISGGPGSRGRG